MSIREVRLVRLQELLAEAGGKQAELARRIGKSPSQLNQWLSGVRTITEDSAREIETSAGKSPRWMDGAPPSAQAHSMSHLQPIVAPITIQWRDLKMGEIPASFALVMFDDSMAPDAPKGATVWFERDLVPRAPDWVLLIDDAKNWCMREYKERRPGHWEAHAVNKAYLPLDSARDGLRVAAVYVGMKARRGQG